MFNIKFLLGWHWIWLLGVALLFAAPAVLWRGRRLAYVAVCCAMLACGAALLPLRNFNAREQLGPRFMNESPGMYTWNSIGFESCGNGFGVSRVTGTIRSPGGVNEGRNGVQFEWVRDGLDPGELRYPEMPSPKFSLAGLQVWWTSLSGRVEGMSGSSWRVVFPAYFPIPFLLILPALWTRRFFKRRKVARWAREGRCAKCGYDLRASPDCCPNAGPLCRRVRPRPHVPALPAVAARRRCAWLILKPVHRPPSFFRRVPS